MRTTIILTLLGSVLLFAQTARADFIIPCESNGFPSEDGKDELTRQVTMRYFGKAFNFRDLQRFIGEYQVAETQLLPNPFDDRNPATLLAL